MSRSTFPCGILPPHLLTEITRRGSPSQQRVAAQTLAGTERMRARRSLLESVRRGDRPSHLRKDRVVFDAHHTEDVPGTRILDETSPRSRDLMAREAFAAAGATFDFYAEAYGRNSLDGRGLRLEGSIHYAKKFDNAFWNGSEMVYGDGDGEIFFRFTRCLEIIGHELTHGVIQYSAALEYSGQAGALNESLADVFGSLVKQHHLGQSADQADWLVGADLLRPGVKGVALRSLKSPGTAYDDPVLGRDRQPAHMRDFVRTAEDNGGVHINSGIPNKAFYETASRLGGHAWETAGWIWYQTLIARLHPRSSFRHAAQQTLAVATERFGAQSREAHAVRDAWETVGVSPGRISHRRKKNEAALAAIARGLKWEEPAHVEEGQTADRRLERLIISRRNIEPERSLPIDACGD